MCCQLVAEFVNRGNCCPELITIRCGDPAGSADGVADAVGSYHHRLDLGGSDVEAAGVCSQLAVEVSDGRVEIGTQPTSGQVDSSLVCFCDSCAQVRQVFGKTRFKVLSRQVHVGLVGCGNACLHVGEVSGKLRLQPLCRQLDGGSVCLRDTGFGIIDVCLELHGQVTGGQVHIALVSCGDTALRI